MRGVRLAADFSAPGHGPGRSYLGGTARKGIRPTPRRKRPRFVMRNTQDGLQRREAELAPRKQTEIF
jgi:hypothetical protein